MECSVGEPVWNLLHFCVQMIMFVLVVFSMQFVHAIVAGVWGGGES